MSEFKPPEEDEVVFGPNDVIVERLPDGTFPTGPHGASVHQGAGPLGFQNSAIAAGLGGFVDIAAIPFQALGITGDEPFGGSRSIERGMEALGIDVAPEGAEPTNMLQRAGESIGLGATMLLPMGAAGRALQVAKGPVKRAVGEMLMSPFVNKFVGATTTELAASIAAGEGGQMAFDKATEMGFSPEIAAIARSMGEIGGGLGGVGAAASVKPVLRNTPAGFAMRAGAKALFPFTPAGSRFRATDRITGLVADTEATKARLGEETIADLTAAQRSQEPGLMAVDEAIRGSDPVRAAEFAARNKASRRELEEFLRAEGGDARDASKFFAGRQAEVEAKIKQPATDAAQRAQQRVSRLGPDLEV